ncbi:hypothetical protein CFC21_074393 [Triticum aestivum]|uniref:Uncharacterized protein n=3 Tax=Triticum TaxID=4564 RepID=A0A9R1HMQ3_WHEAT|nr:protein LURP-one-related 15-like [Triticum aestivum]KAF7068656.1 hypothetical protein CFC21_074391 [Triticum aestivum]KAF7068657.1 hypothetical protein CFC21_074392 [Triticum aestivum]KAF7068658.1 hypothetical protein CFC21_074393 [Triticum aestivum]VAI38909.1 unnamed protein product [Triticum turgidum subsp. durum]
MAARTGAVVDARFCAPHATEFTLTKTKSWFRDFTITDASGAAVMKVDAPPFTFVRRSILVDAASRRPLVTTERSPTLFTLGRRWEAFKGDGSRPRDLLFSAVVQPWLFVIREVHVHLAGGDRSEKNPDFVIRLSSCGREWTVSRGRSDGGAAVATIKRTTGLFLFEGLAFSVSVSPGVDHAFILALAVILHEIRQDGIQRGQHAAF